MSALNDEGPLKYLIDLENGCSDPDMKDNIQALRLLISILSTFLRFLLDWPVDHKEIKELADRMVNVVQQVSWSFVPLPPILRMKPVEDYNQRNAELVAYNWERLRRLKDDFARIRKLYCSFPLGICCSGKYGDEHLKCYLNALPQNLKDITSSICSARRTISQREELVEMEERLGYLATFLCLISVPSKYVNVMDSIGKLAIEISYRLFLWVVDDDELVVQGDFIKKFNSLRLELKEVSDGSDILRRQQDDEQIIAFVDILISKLMLLSAKDGFMDELQIQFDILAEEYTFIRSFLMDMLFPHLYQELESLNFPMAALIFDVGFFICFSPFKVGNEEPEMTNYWRLGLHNSLEAVQTVQQAANDLFEKHLPPMPLLSDLLDGNEVGLIDVLIEKLEEIIDSDSGASFNTHQLKHRLEILNDELVLLRNDLSVVAEMTENSPVALLTRLKHVAYESEYVLDSLMALERPFWIDGLGIFVITNNIKILQKEAKTILKMTSGSGVSFIPEASTQTHHPLSTNAADSSKDAMPIKLEEDAKELVGRKDAVADIVGLLTEGLKSQLKIISIVGMAGLGKSALANAVYKHPSVDAYFHLRAWVCISQIYQKETLLSSILGQIREEDTNQSKEKSEEDLGQMLYQSLKRKRYLIVLDNVWDIDIWDDLRLCFPDDENGSRILFTTRNHDCAAKANSFLYVLRLLSEEESCELLWRMLFKRETCPQNLSSILEYIASSCKGLPLALILVAGTLNVTNKAKDSWEKVAKTFIKSQSIQEGIWDIIEGSYKLLPDHLKSCFWYFGTFPGGTRISVSKMMRLWISLGFVQQPNLGGKSLMQEAESYLSDLIDRSLVLVARNSSKGGVKECYVHDILREFCSAKLQQKRYEMQERIPGGISVLCGDLKRLWPRQSLFSKFSRTKELDICSLIYYSMSDIEKDSRDRVDLPEQEELRDSPPRIGSTYDCKQTMFSDLRYSTGKTNLTYDVPGKGIGISRNRRLNYGSLVKHYYLKVLDLANVPIQDGADAYQLVQIAKLVHLRYLAVKLCTNKIPSEIANLCNLEFLHISGAIGKIILPEAIWKLVCLRDVIMDHCFFSFKDYSREFFEDTSQMVNLKSLSTMYIWHGNVERLMRMLPGVQKLGCIFSKSWQECYEANNLFKILECLHELQSLKMSFLAKAPYPLHFGFPLTLKKLTMSNACLPWYEISVIGQLPNLEVLKLLEKAFEGQQWDMREGEFQKLKFLKLDSLDVVQWDAYSDHLPCLEQLVVVSCQQLEVVPSCFGEISTLQSIELKWCSASAANSLKQIVDTQLDYGNHQFNVIVSRRAA